MLFYSFIDIPFFINPFSEVWKCYVLQLPCCFTVVMILLLFFLKKTKWTYSQRQRLTVAVADLLDSSRESSISTICNSHACCFTSFVFSLVCIYCSPLQGCKLKSQLQLPTVKLQTLSRTPYDSGDWPRQSWEIMLPSS